MAKALQLEGERYGRLVVLERRGSRGGKSTWLCRCDCGSERTVCANELRSGDTESCGCLYRETRGQQALRHGHYRKGQATAEREAWNGMIQRCANPNKVGYPNYGGRGISVCERWRDDFMNFLSDMGPRPGPGFSLDRIDVDGDYEPGNCRWATRDVQNSNTTRTIRVKVNGKEMSLTQAARDFGLNPGTVRSRHDRGIPLVFALWG